MVQKCCPFTLCPLSWKRSLHCFRTHQPISTDYYKIPCYTYLILFSNHPTSVVSKIKKNPSKCLITLISLRIYHHNGASSVGMSEIQATITSLWQAFCWGNTQAMQPTPSPPKSLWSVGVGVYILCMVQFDLLPSPPPFCKSKITSLWFCKVYMSFLVQFTRWL